MTEILVEAKAREPTFDFKFDGKQNVKQLRFEGFYDYMFKINGVQVASVDGETVVDFTSLLHKLHVELTRENGPGHYHPKIPDYMILISCGNDIDISPGTPRSPEELESPDWNSIRAHRFDQFTLFPLNHARVEGGKIYAVTM